MRGRLPVTVPVVLSVGGVLAAVLVGGVALGLHHGPAVADPAVPASSATTPATAPAPEPRLVLVSGRDDHGMVHDEVLSLYDAPDGGRVTARVPDATLARVVAVDGQWLRVRTVEGAAATGWIDDFHLRGEVRLVGAAPSCRSSIDGRARDGGTLVVVRELRQGRVRVDSVTPPLTSGWAPRADLQELPPQGADCGDVPPDDKHAHHH